MDSRGRMTLQFHITGRCNLRCRHCYRQEGNVEPLTYGDICRVVEQFLALTERNNRTWGTDFRGHINLTGGEPFLHKDIDRVLTLLGRCREKLSYGVLTNGSFLNSAAMALLKETGAAFVQLSLDGNRELHDCLRCPGDYDRVLAVAGRLERAGISTQLSFTANRDNMQYLPQAAWECRRRGISKLWTDRLVPIGTGQALENLAITREALPDYLAALKKAQGNALTRLVFPKTRVTGNRALQFLGCQGSVYACSAGTRLSTVDEFGTSMPCRRMPIACGDIFSSSLEEVYYRSPVFQSLRQSGIPEECGGCRYRHTCGGGARCQSYAACGSFRRADPGCPLARRG